MSRTLATRRISRRDRRCVNNYPCGGRISPGDTYWALALPPDTEPFWAKGWTHAAECDQCHADRPPSLPIEIPT